MSAITASMEGKGAFSHGCALVVAGKPERASAKNTLIEHTLSGKYQRCFCWIFSSQIFGVFAYTDIARHYALAAERSLTRPDAAAFGFASKRSDVTRRDVTRLNMLSRQSFPATGSGLPRSRGVRGRAGGAPPYCMRALELGAPKTPTIPTNRPNCFLYYKALHCSQNAGWEEGTVTERDFQELLAAIKRFDAEHNSPEAARKVLQEEGVLTEKGEIAEPYAKPGQADA
jgi:hypothetical protein